MQIEDLDFDKGLLEGMQSMGYKTLTPIQQLAIPVIQEGKDLIACAQTGTGKTAAYLLPVLNHIISSEKKHLNTLIIAPTRELAIQIDQQVEALGYFIPVSSIAVYGGGSGADWDQQRKALRLGAELVIATPGRLIAMLASGEVKFDQLEHLILDEADRMLDMGFSEDILKIISYLPKKRQTLLFSATMPPKIRKLAKAILQDPEEVNVAVSKPAEGVLQQAYMVYDNQKVGLLKHILQNGDYNNIIIFCSTKQSTKTLEKELQRLGVSVKSFHSDLDQKEREEIMLRFKNKELKILVGTDILSRGIDVDGIGLVVNYDIPPDPEDYIHRIGRTARAERTGTAITFINDTSSRKFAGIESLMGREVAKVPLPEHLGAGPAFTPSKGNSAPVRRFNRFRKGNKNKSRSNKTS
ncbi:MAG: ATP-dependent RNA helicase [Cytophagaceae bacterium SCN 52-12]|nr:MAG: ATP-dependent RNA helicase [Cytophagaceae bacterium SCN 52-12]